MNFWIVAKMQQHAHTVRQREGGDIGVEVRIPLHKVAQCREKLFVEYEAVAAGMGGDDRDPFVECPAQPVRIAQRLVSSDQGEFVADMAEKRECAIGQGTIERLVLGIGQIGRASCRERVLQVV